MTVEIMEKLEVAITVLLILLVSLSLYVAVTWTYWRRRNKRLEENGPPFEYLQETDSAEWRVLSPQYTPSEEDTAPKVAIQPVQPRPDLPKYLVEAESSGSEMEEDHFHFDLGRLYFALQYDHHRSMLLVRLIRGEDIPSEQEASGPYVGVQLLPLNTETQIFEPCDTTVNVHFQETYEFPLSQSQLSLQTINFNICRYDRYTRKTNVGDVFLALAELGAQGIDITREVYLCRNIISSEQLCRIVHRKRTLFSSDEDKQEANNHRDKKTILPLNPADPKEMWARLRRAVRSGEYRGKIKPNHGTSDAPLFWEPLFVPGSGNEAIEEYRLPSSSADPETTHHSGPGPPRRRHTLSGANQEWDDFEGTSERLPLFVFPSITASTEAKCSSQSSSKSNSKEDLGRNRVQSSESSQASPLRLSPAPEEYYKLVPMTPLASGWSPFKGKRPKNEPPVSWRVPETSTSRDRDVVQTLATSYREPRVIATARLGVPVPPSAGRIGYRPPTTGPSVPSRITLRSAHHKPKHSMHKKRKRKSLRRTVSSPFPRDSRDVSATRHACKMPVRLEPEGRAAPEGLRTKAKHVKTKKFLYKSKMKTAAKSYKTHSPEEDYAALPWVAEGNVSDLEQEDTRSQKSVSSTAELEIPEASSQLTETSYESVSGDEFHTPFSSPIKKRDWLSGASFEKVQSEPLLSPQQEEKEKFFPRAMSLTSDIFKTKEGKNSMS